MENRRADGRANQHNNKQSTISPFISSPDTARLRPCSLRTAICTLYQGEQGEGYQTAKQENAKMRKRKQRGGERGEAAREGGREERAFTAVVRQCFL